MVLPSSAKDDEDDRELRVAFDFDGVITDDEAEAVLNAGNLELFAAHEVSKANIPHRPGPLSDLFKKLSFFQRLERRSDTLGSCEVVPFCSTMLVPKAKRLRACGTLPQGADATSAAKRSWKQRLSTPPLAGTPVAPVFGRGSRPSRGEARQ
jgi:hypothetical protein